MNEVPYLLIAVISMTLNLLLLYKYLGAEQERQDMKKRINKHCESLTKLSTSLKGGKK